MSETTAGGDLQLEQRIRAMLAGRASTSSICPSDVARAITPNEKEWRALMEPIRQAAKRLVASGEVEITQHGEVIDPTTIKGPIRIRFPRP